MLSDSTCVIIEEIQIEQLQKPETTYNFEVEDFHTYYVTESKILVHNKCWEWGDGGRGSAENNINYHHGIHKSEFMDIGLNEYVELSYEFADEIVEKGIKAAHKVSGVTPNIYRYYYQGYYIDMNINKKIIVSFGWAY